MRQPGIRTRVVVTAVLAVAFVAMTLAVTAGMFATLDQQVADTMHSAWRAELHPLFQGIAELGGIELTSLLMVGLVIYLLRAGFGSDAFVFMALVIAQVLEILYKSFLHHPSPPRSISESDGPSFSAFFAGAGGGNSFPSGHMVRTVIVFGLIAFVVRRLSESVVIRRLALAVVIILVVVMAFDRLYLNVHWESDVIGGLLLGGIGLVAGTVWLDRPRKVRR
jgi:membrane-associated phospholipid phosphatase